MVIHNLKDCAIKLQQNLFEPAAAATQHTFKPDGNQWTGYLTPASHVVLHAGRRRHLDCSAAASLLTPVHLTIQRSSVAPLQSQGPALLKSELMDKPWTYHPCFLGVGSECRQTDSSKSEWHLVWPGFELSGASCCWEEESDTSGIAQDSPSCKQQGTRTPHFTTKPKVALQPIIEIETFDSLPQII